MNNGMMFTKTHEWVRKEGEGVVLAGLSAHAVTEMGDLVFINLPQVGTKVTAGETMADVESVKAVSDVYSPVSGVVAEVNESLADAPEKINEAPYASWIAKIESVEIPEGLMTEEEYEEYLKDI
ncbi:MAG: glycine cleavage system protein GcvH [Eubacteriales bacterium]|jgi:glycine cleavage system H protein|nr:glycine cleavage system protein GcvH [Eubacteriales bacterium]MDD4327832.1 glycine cleavage system protein GcvH [Eubacteriales bacterium]MDD4717208.1 glycine cleavage system protein GcvH [Eubacteriales bacterium]NCU26325.1 glycine cleavage system protein GcvH [Candidatus Nomurabacteria bacterium]